VQRAYGSSIVSEELVELASPLQGIVEKDLRKATRFVSYLEFGAMEPNTGINVPVRLCWLVFAVPRGMQFLSGKNRFYLLVDGLQLLCKSGVSMVPPRRFGAWNCGAEPYR
jgi:hypothetical protein